MRRPRLRRRGFWPKSAKVSGASPAPRRTGRDTPPVKITTPPNELDALVELLASPEAERLSLDVVKRAHAMFSERRIELAERRASPKQLAFQKAFFDRADPTGRRCGLFIGLGANRSGKTFACGWLCFAKYLRDVARAGDLFWCVSQNLERSIGGQQRELWEALPRIMFGTAWDSKIGF